MKVTIRDLFLVTMIVALAVGWGVDSASYRGLRNENVRITKKLKETDRMLRKTVYVLIRKEDPPTPALPKSSAPAQNPPSRER